jgi:ubiquinone/menaquinone biosynthesis C-methylase UbiE
VRDYLAPVPNFSEPGNVALYDELTFWSARFGAILLAHLPLAPGLAILDVACGAGFPTLELAQMYGDSCHVTGVDVWDAALDRARQKQALYGLENAEFLRADAADLPLPDQSIDLIVCNLGLNNFAQPERVLAECARVARPGAGFYLATNPLGHMRELYAALRAVLVETGDPALVERLDAHEAHRRTPDAIAALVRDAGFTVTGLVHESFALRYLDGSAFLRHFFIRLAFLPDWRAIVAGADEPALFAALEGRLNALTREQGELRLTVPMLLVAAARTSAPLAPAGT